MFNKVNFVIVHEGLVSHTWRRVNDRGFGVFQLWPQPSNQKCW